MPSLAILTFGFAFLAMSRSLLRTKQAPQTTDSTSDTLRIEVLSDLKLTDLEKLVAIATALQGHPSRE